MVMKHGNQFESFYDHMTYPVDLYRTLCSVGDCGSNGKYLSADPLLVQVDWSMVNSKEYSIFIHIYWNSAIFHPPLFRGFIVELILQILYIFPSLQFGSMHDCIIIFFKFQTHISENHSELVSPPNIVYLCRCCDKPDLKFEVTFLILIYIYSKSYIFIF